MLDLNVKRIVIFGLNGSGKTVLAKFLCSQVTKHLVFDYHNEYKSANHYIVKFKDNYEQRVTELNEVINKVVKKNVMDLFVVDEINKYAYPKPTELPEGLRDLNDNHRHYYNEKGISFIGIARRPTQIHTDLIELAHYKVFFVLSGKNDLNYLESLKEGLGETVRNLKPYHFAILDTFGNVEVYEPVRLVL